MADRLEAVRFTFKHPVRSKLSIEVADGWTVAFDKSDGTVALARGPDDVVVVHWSNIAWIDMKRVEQAQPAKPVEPTAGRHREATGRDELEG
jgi:hypothetical protein